MYTGILPHGEPQLKCTCGREMKGTTKMTKADLISDHTAELEEMPVV